MADDKEIIPGASLSGAEPKEPERSAAAEKQAQSNENQGTEVIPGTSLSGTAPKEPERSKAAEKQAKKEEKHGVPTPPAPELSDEEKTPQETDSDETPFPTEGTVADGSLDASREAEFAKKEEHGALKGDARDSVFEPAEPEKLEAEDDIEETGSADPDYVVGEDQYYTAPEETTWIDVALHFEIPNPAIAARELAAINEVKNGYPRVPKGTTILLWSGYDLYGKKGVRKTIDDDAILPIDRD